MAIGSGIGASFGMVDESTYGTYVAPTRWLAGTSFMIQPQIVTTPVEGIAAGRFADPDEVVTGRNGIGQWTGQVPTTKWGLMMKHLFGTTATPTQQAATAAYLQTLPFVDTFGKSFTAQVGVPLTTGTVVPYTGTGGKITACEFSSEVNSPLTATVDFAFQNVVDSQSLAAPSYVASSVLNGNGSTIAALTVKQGTYASEAAVSGIRSASVKIERPVDVERPGIPGAYPEPIMNDKVKVSGTLSPDFLAKADFADRFLAHTSPPSLVLQWTGALIASTYHHQLTITMPKVYYREAIPGVDGPDIIKGSVAFDAFYDATNGLVIGTLMSTDTTV